MCHGERRGGQGGGRRTAAGSAVRVRLEVPEQLAEHVRRVERPRVRAEVVAREVHLRAQLQGEGRGREEGLRSLGAPVHTQLNTYLRKDVEKKAVRVVLLPVLLLDDERDIEAALDVERHVEALLGGLRNGLERRRVRKGRPGEDGLGAETRGRCDDRYPTSPAPRTRTCISRTRACDMIA